MVVFDKAEIKEYLSLENLYDLLVEWGGEPEYTSFGLISSTICHNMPGQGSRKLYYYENSVLFHCYTGCEEPNFDIFQLCIKINSIQNHLSFDLNDAVRWVAQRFGISGVYQQDDDKKVLDDWKYFENYERIQDIELKTHDVILKEYESVSNERLMSRLSETLPDGGKRYLIKVGANKIVVDVKDNKINHLMDLC
jgi:hypothetical protein